MKRAAPPSRGVGLARTRMATMPEDELSLLTSDRLIASYGLTLGEADHLIRTFRRV